mgnify:CR=1 FL=1
MTGTTRKAARTLASVANSQGGYFTSKQAAGAGYSYQALQHHVAVGNFQRVEHGLYRLPSVPHDEHDDLIRLTLWSRNQQDEPQAVISHETALGIHELTALLPDRIHLTVPKRFRKEVPEVCVVHKAELADDEIEERVGFRVTTPLRTLADAVQSGVSSEQLEQGLKDALDRGVVSRAQLSSAKRRYPALDRFLTTFGKR